MEHPKDILRLIAKAFTEAKQKQLADEIKVKGKGIDQAQFSRVVNGTEVLSEARRAALVDFVNSKVTLNPKLTDSDLNLTKEKFVERFAGTHVYSIMQEGLGVSSKKEDDFALARLELLNGWYVGLFLCAHPDDRLVSVVGTDRFKISLKPHAPHADIFQLTNIDALEPRGFVKVKDTTIEIEMDFRNVRYPNAKFLAKFPHDRDVSMFLAIVVDIKTRSMDVVARPILFVRTEYPLILEQFYPKKSPIFKALKALFESHVSFNQERLEIVPLSRINDAHFEAVKKALNSIQKSAQHGTKRAGP